MISYSFGKKQSEYHFNLSRFLELNLDVNLHIKQSKTVPPFTTVTRNGIEVDTLSQTLTLPMSNVTSLRLNIIDMAKGKKATLKEMQSLIGSLNFACRAIALGRAFQRRLIGLTRGCRRAKHRVRLATEARRDISAWLEFLQTFNGRCALPITSTSSDVLHLITYASGFAHGAVMGDSWLQGRFPHSWHSEHISTKQLLPIVLAVRHWGPVLTNQRVLFFSYNTAVVAVVNIQTARDPQLMCLVRQLMFACLLYNICFRAKHIPGKNNIVADSISQLQVERARGIQSSLEDQPTQAPTHWLPWHTAPCYVLDDVFATSSASRYEQKARQGL